jgi:hypothetical protein
MRGERGFQRGVPGLYLEEVGVVYGGLCRMRLGTVGGVWGQHCAPVLGDRQVVSVAGLFTRGMSGFRERAGETVGCWSVSMLSSAGRGWHCVCRSMLCRCAY